MNSSFFSTPLAWQWVCDPLTSLVLKTTVSWPSSESYYRRKLFIPVYSLNKRISDIIRPTIFFPTISPVFSRKWVPNMIETTERHNRTAHDGTEIICVCTCVGKRICMCVCTEIHTYIYSPAGHCKILSHDILSRNEK